MNNYVSLWDTLPSSISWLISQRDNSNFNMIDIDIQQKVRGINYSIILNSNSMVEGFLDTTSRRILDFKTKFIGVKQTSFGQP